MSRHRRQASQVLPPPDQLFSADDDLPNFSDTTAQLGTACSAALHQNSKPTDGPSKARDDSVALGDPHPPANRKPPPGKQG